MSEDKKPIPPAPSPKLEKLRNDLDRLLRDYDISQADYSALIDDMKKRRRRIEGSGDSVFDDIADE